jgi:hypothetical protein
MNKLIIRPSAIAQILAAIAALLVIASTAGHLTRYFTHHGRIFGLIDLFSLDGERNIPTLYSTFLLLFAALLLGFIAVIKAKERCRHTSKWVVLTVGFVCMAIDEAWSFHERLGPPVRAWLAWKSFGFLYFAWIIPALVLVLGLGAYFLRFLSHLPRRTRFAFLMAAVLFLSGTVGIESLEGHHVELYGRDNLTYIAMFTLEESLEMAGIIFYIYALLQYISEHYRDIGFCFVEGAPAYVASARGAVPEPEVMHSEGNTPAAESGAGK